MYMCFGGVYTRHATVWGQRTALLGLMVSSSTIWVLGAELKLWGLRTGAFAHEVTSQLHKVLLHEKKKQSGHKRIMVRYCHAPGITTAGEREAYHTFRNSLSCMTKVQLLNTIRNKGDSSFSWVHLLINRAVTVYEIVGMTLIRLLGYKTVVCRLLELRSCFCCCYNHSVLNADVLIS